MSAFSAYWKAYGGMRALLLSPYATLAGIFWAFCKPIWFDKFKSGELWTDWALSLIAGLLAFSLGALAIFLAFSNEKFLSLIRQRGKVNSYFMSVVAAFFHFILIQFLAVALIVLSFAYETVFFSALSFYLFCYAMACGIAAAAALVDTAEIINLMGELDEDD